MDEVLHPGEYVILVGPFWNDTVENDPQYKELLIDIYSKYKLNIEPVKDFFGMSLLERTLKLAAIEQTPVESKRKYISHMDGYERVFRVVFPYNAFESSYGIVYTKNNSRYPLRETQTFDLYGMDIIWPSGVRPGIPYEMDLRPEEDEIVILRRTDESC